MGFEIHAARGGGCNPGSAACVATLWRGRAADAPPAPVGRRLAALIAAVTVGVAPAVVIKGWPLTRVFESRFFLPVLLMASCATMALLLAVLHSRFASVAILAVTFLAANRLVLGAIEERRLQSTLERFGERVRPLVLAERGLLVVVSPDRLRISEEEEMVKATSRWGSSQRGRLWILRPDEAAAQFGPRSGCRLPSP